MLVVIFQILIVLIFAISGCQEKRAVRMSRERISPTAELWRR